MGFRELFFGKQRKIRDDFFGEMLFIEIRKNPAKSYFECQRYFEPTGELIELAVSGQASGPTLVQKDFFTQVEKHYSLIVAALIPVIEDEFQNWQPEFSIIDFAREFTPGHMVLPTCEQRPVEWEITFDTIHDLDHVVSVTMLDYQPLHIMLDG